MRIKEFVFEGVHGKVLTDEFPDKSPTKRGVNKPLNKLRDTGTVDRATERNHTTTGSFQLLRSFLMNAVR